MNTTEEIINTKQIVEELMTQDERCRNDDKWLVYRVTSKFTKIFIPFADFNKFPSFETVTRSRRIIQNNEHRLLPTIPEVAIKRGLREEIFRNINKL